MSVNELKRISRMLAVMGLIVMECQPQSITAESSVYGRVTTLRGRPIKDVVVQFYKLLPKKEGGGEKLVSEAISDEAGHYEAKGLDWGRYRVHFKGKSPYFNDEDIWGFFVSNGSRSMLDVALTGGMPAHLGAISKVRGVVTDEAGTPRAGATVVIIPVYGPSQYRQQYTDNNGEFAYVIEDGTHLIYATTPGAVSEPIRFQVRGVETRGNLQKTLTLKLLPIPDSLK